MIRQRVRLMSILPVLLRGAVTGTAAGPAEAASPGVATVTGSNSVRYAAGSNQANSVVVTRSGRTITIDDRVPVKAGKGCTAVRRDPTKVRCTTSKHPALVSVHTG